jgi:cold shock CspA family protein/ribosome-associated translation inhibitor RaiA
MKLEPQIAFRNLEPSDELKAKVREEVERLETYFDRITGCRVAVEVPHHHHRRGNCYRVRIDLTVPGEEIVVNRGPGEHEEYRDPDVAIRDAFDAARRRLEDYARRRRGAVKAHPEAQPHAKVRELLPHADHGFLETPDGREIFFHRRSVVGGRFEDLAPGTEVTFVEVAGEKGPQASTVRPAGRHHHL